MVSNFPNNFLNKRKFQYAQAAFHKECLGNPFAVTLRYHKVASTGDFLRDFVGAKDATTYDLTVKALYNMEEYERARVPGMNDQRDMTVYFSRKQIMETVNQIATDFPTALSFRNSEQYFHIVIQDQTFQVKLVTLEGYAFDDCIALGFKGSLVVDA